MMILETLAAKAAEYFLLRLGDGFVEKLGADAKDLIQNLFLTIRRKLPLNEEQLRSLPTNPDFLRQEILKTARLDTSFRQQLEELVKALNRKEEAKREEQKLEASNNQGTTAVIGTIENIVGDVRIGGTQDTYNFR